MNEHEEKMLDRFTRNYLETGLWSEMDVEGFPLDENFDVDDIHKESFDAAKEDCESFLKMVGSWVADQFDYGDLADNFWLTRNRHGAGFWDGDFGKYGEFLTEISHTFGECHLYVCDEQVHLS